MSRHFPYWIIMKHLLSKDQLSYHIPSCGNGWICVEPPRKLGCLLCCHRWGLEHEWMTFNHLLKTITQLSCWYSLNIGHNLLFSSTPEYWCLTGRIHAVLAPHPLRKWMQIYATEASLRSASTNAECFQVEFQPN